MRAAISPAAISPGSEIKSRRRSPRRLMLQLLGLAAMAAGAVAGSGEIGQARHGRRLRRNRRRDAHGACLPAGRRILGRPGRRHLSQCHPPIRTWTARDLGVHELKAVRRAGHQSLPAIPPAPPAASRPASLTGRGEPVFRRQGPARASGPPRPGEGQAVRLSRSAGDDVQPLPLDRSLPSRSLCARHRHLSQVGGAGRACPSSTP